jgi:hypothetical protein
VWHVLEQNFGITRAVTFTGSWVSNATYAAKETRIGQWAEYDVLVSCTGSPTAANLSITLPTGRTIDTNQITSTGSANTFGLGSATDSGTASYSLRVTYSSTTALVAYWIGDIAGEENYQGLVSNSAPFSFGSGDSVNFKFRIPISEWA